MVGRRNRNRRISRDDLVIVDRVEERAGPGALLLLRLVGSRNLCRRTDAIEGDEVLGEQTLDARA
jgi:hypothetical protein